MGKKSVENLDQSLFVLINSTLTNGFFDWLMPSITDLHKNKVFAFGVFPLILAFWAYKQRLAMVPVLIFGVMCVGASDLTTYRILKPTFKRERPPVNEKQIIMRTNRWAGHSFPSNHAANNFALATFLGFCYPALSLPLLTVATLVAFSRVYVGVHYPADVIAGALMGMIFGLFFFKIWEIISKRRMTRKDYDQQDRKPQAENS
jgi:undecaprenyl-diphosphatase